VTRPFYFGAAVTLAIVALAGCSKSGGANTGAGAGDQSGGGRGDYFKRMDANGDGKVSQDEYVQARREQFKRLDTDGDGKLSMAEIEASGRDRMIDRLKALDANHDGFVDQTEYDAGSVASFKHMDKNNDGFLTPDEMPARHGGGEGGGGGGSEGRGGG
jgi:hypothetical protein